MQFFMSINQIDSKNAISKTDISRPPDLLLFLFVYYAHTFRSVAVKKFCNRWVAIYYMRVGQFHKLLLTYLIFTMFLIFCRLKKCYAVGMRADCVVPEDQCIKKRMAKSKNNETNSTSPLSNGHAHERHLSGGSDNGIVMTGVLTHTANGSLKRQVVPFVSRPLKPEEEELINRLVYFQIEYEFPKEEDLKKIYHVPLHCQGTESESDSLFRHITEMTILTVNLIVEFCKHLPGFTSLDKEDQVVILKGCSSEVMMLRAARRYA